MEISQPIFIFLFGQYLGSALIAVLFSFYVILKEKKSLTMVSLFVFGILVAIWELLVFFHRTADSSMLSALFFRYAETLYPLLLGVLLFTFLTIWKKRKANLLWLIPALVLSYLYFAQCEYSIYPSDFGWAYSVIPPSVEMGMLISVLLFGYTVGIAVVLLYLSRKATNPVLRKKLKLLFWAYVLFQGIGFFGINTLIHFGLNIPPFGGLFYILSFMTLFFVARIKHEVRHVVVDLNLTDKLALLEGFLRDFYASLPEEDVLGSRQFAFESHLKDCGLRGFIRLTERGIEIDPGFEPKPEDFACLIDKALTMLEEGKVDPKLYDSLVKFVNNLFPLIEVSLLEIIKKHEHYVRKTGFIYEVGDGRLRIILIPEGFSERDLDLFSRSIGLNHRKILNSRILYEFDPDSGPVSTVRNFVMECLANGEKCYVFTRYGSNIHKSLKELKGIDFFLLSPTISRIIELGKNEKLVSADNLSQILGIFSMIGEGERSAIVFDNLTDMILLTSFEHAYKLVRHSLDILARSGCSLMFLLNKEVHDRNTIAAFEPLFDLVLVAKKGIIKHVEKEEGN